MRNIIILAAVLIPLAAFAGPEDYVKTVAGVDYVVYQDSAKIDSVRVVNKNEFKVSIEYKCHMGGFCFFTDSVVVLQPSEKAVFIHKKDYTYPRIRIEDDRGMLIGFARTYNE